MKSLWGTLLFVVLVACSPSSRVITPTATVNTIPTNTQMVLPTAPVVSSRSVPPADSPPAPTSITPQVEIIAPNMREVDLSDLGLSNTSRLILYYEPSNSLRIMSGQDIKPQKIYIDSEAWLDGGIEISPDQKWFIYKVSKGIKDDVLYLDYWLSSVDGKEQKIVITNARGGTEVRWVTNEQIELWYYPSGQRVCPKRESIINVFTQEALIPPAVPPSIKIQCFFDLSTNPDRSKVIYLNENGLWSIYDFNTGESQNVLRWLSKSERFALWPRYVHWSTNGITLVLPHQESIDFAVDIPVSDLSKSNVALNKVLLPEGKKMYNDRFSWWALDKGFVGFDLIDIDYDYSESGKASPSSSFMILDLKRSVLYDYNFDRARTGESQKVTYPFVFSSADNRFLAWTIYEPPHMGPPSETVVLDRKTGRIARIKGFAFFGWGEINQP